MPVVPVIGTGLSLFLQWLILPIVAHLTATRDHSGSRRTPFLLTKNRCWTKRKAGAGVVQW